MQLSYNQGYCKVDKFAIDDSKSRWKSTFWYVKYSQESPNSNFGMF